MTSNRKPEETKLILLKEAEKEFADKGFLGASVNTIAKKAGINKRMIYHHFGSKEDLYRTVLKHNFEKIYYLGQDILREKEDPVDLIKEMIKRYLYFLYENDNYVKIINWEEITGGVFIKEIAKDTLTPGLQELNEIFKIALVEGIIRKEMDLRQLILSINGLCMITFVRRSIFEDIYQEEYEDFIERRLQHIYSLIFTGILIKGEK